MPRAKGDRPVELVRQIEKASPLAAARLHRQLTVDEAAKRAGLTPDEVEWLEAGRVYRFPSADAALVATLLYATALGIDHREARILAGLPVASKPVETVARGRRLLVLAVVAAALAALVAVLIVVPGSDHPSRPAAVEESLLPAPWRIQVDVLNGAGDINYTRQVASRIQSLAYRIGRVTRAPRSGPRFPRFGSGRATSSACRPSAGSSRRSPRSRRTPCCSSRRPRRIGRSPSRRSAPACTSSRRSPSRSRWRTLAPWRRRRS